MTTRNFRTIPLSMQQDGWWLDAPPNVQAKRQIARRRDVMKLVLLVALIACGDILVWNVAPALSLALLVLLIFMAGLAVSWPRLSVRARIGVAAGATLSVLPVIELVQPLSLLIAVSGLSACCAALAGLGRHDVLRGAVRLWWVAPAHSVACAAVGLRRLGDLRAGVVDTRAILLAWALPLGATAVFALLLVGANPVLDRALSRLGDWQVPAPDMWRLWFWLALALAIWPVLVAGRMRERLRARRPLRATVRRQGVMNAGSVARSLVAFNGLFAVQTVMDIMFLYGDAGLPEGISPATYAHRGAYPLLITALLAGLFAVLARPYLAGRPVLRWLMLLWLCQTLALVVASLWRLEAYVDVYGLTRLRVAAYIWMGLVAAGLGIVFWQIWRDKPAAWMLLRSGALGAVVIYGVTFINIDGLIATHNLTRPVAEDRWMLCGLSEGALPALHRYLAVPPDVYCPSGSPRLFTPENWREWGFRNWRLRRSLAAMTTYATAP